MDDVKPQLISYWRHSKQQQQGPSDDFFPPLQGLTGPDGPAGKDGPSGEPVSVSWSFGMLRIHLNVHQIGLRSLQPTSHCPASVSLSQPPAGQMNTYSTNAKFACWSDLQEALTATRPLFSMSAWICQVSLASWLGIILMRDQNGVYFCCSLIRPGMCTISHQSARWFQIWSVHWCRGKQQLSSEWLKETTESQQKISQSINLKRLSTYTMHVIHEIIITVTIKW